MTALEPKGKKTERIEAICEPEIRAAIDLMAEALAGIPSGAKVPPGFHAEAVRELIARGANATDGLPELANARGAEIRVRREREAQES